VGSGGPRGSAGEAPAPKGWRAASAGLGSPSGAQPAAAQAPRPGRPGRGVAAFVPRDMLPLGEREVQARGEEWARSRCGVALGPRPLPSPATHTKGRRGNVQSLPAEGGARPPRRIRLGSHAGRRRSGIGPGTGVGVERQGETGCRMQRDARGWGGSKAIPAPPRDREKGKGGDFRAGDPIQGRCAFGFLHVFPSPSPHLAISRLLGPQLSRQGLSQGV
jgi:hypothetical protein